MGTATVQIEATAAAWRDWWYIGDEYLRPAGGPFQTRAEAEAALPRHPGARVFRSGSEGDTPPQ